MSTLARDLAEALDPPEALLQPRRIPRQIDVDQRAEGLQVQAFARGVGRNEQSDLPSLHRGLDVFALDGGEVGAAKDAALASAGVDRHRLARQRRGQLSSQRAHGVVVLAEDDAAVLEPGLAIGAMLRQEVLHCS